MAYLLMPFWQGIIGLGLVGALLLAILGTAPFWGAGPTYQLVFFYLLAFGGTSLGTIAARSGQGPIGWLRGFLVGQVYTLYTWFLWPVLLRSTVRQLRGHGGWAKTAREPIEPRRRAPPDRRRVSRGRAPDPEHRQAAEAAAAPRAPSAGSSRRRGSSPGWSPSRRSPGRRRAAARSAPSRPALRVAGWRTARPPTISATPEIATDSFFGNGGGTIAS